MFTGEAPPQKDPTQTNELKISKSRPDISLFAKSLQVSLICRSVEIHQGKVWTDVNSNYI